MPKAEFTVCRCHNPEPMCDCPKNWSYCSACGQNITWVVTEKKCNMPVNGHIRADKYNPDHQTTHFATCAARQKEQKGWIGTALNPPARVPVQMDMFAEAALQDIRALRDRQRKP